MKCSFRSFKINLRKQILNKIIYIPRKLEKFLDIFFLLFQNPYRIRILPPLKKNRVLR